MWANRSFRSLKMSDHERFAQVAQRKWAMRVNRSFRSPKVSQWVNRSFFWVNRSFALFWTKNERFTWKSNERIPSPGIIEYLQKGWRDNSTINDFHPYPISEYSTKQKKLKFFLFPCLRRVRSPSRVYTLCIQYSIWQDAGIRTRVAATEARCTTNELHTPLNELHTSL